MMIQKTRFTSLSQGVIFCVGALNGIQGTTRYSIPSELRQELKDIYEYYYLLDELGPLLDRCDELEIFMEAPSTSSGEWKDAEVELMAVVDRINLLCNYLPSSPL